MSGIDRWFETPGAYVLVDGQFGSTGKGLLAGYIAEKCRRKITHVTTNSGPNSGHTAFFQGQKIVTQQLPVASVVLGMMGKKIVTLLNAGAVIDPNILAQEILRWYTVDPLYVHPCAALITSDAKMLDKETLDHIASTGKGVGPAIQLKIARLNQENIASKMYAPIITRAEIQSWDAPWDWKKDCVFVETAQGFSLGLNSARFYPHVTSRECTVMQAIADARIPAQMVRKVVCCFRTFPIRVGNTAGSSGNHYSDQEEITWEAIGQEPELTTVTKRVRRVFTWSRIQFRECIAANRPNVIFLNFCNYLPIDKTRQLLRDILQDYSEVIGGAPDEILGGWGPLSENVGPL